MDSIEIDVDTKCTITQYLKLIRLRASGRFLLNRATRLMCQCFQMVMMCILRSEHGPDFAELCSHFIIVILIACCQ